MSLSNRMKTWRIAQRKRFGGMEAFSIWIPARHAGFIKQVFAKLADPGARGDNYRQAVSGWLSRRRAQSMSFPGTDFSCEIDLPFIGPQRGLLPAGGRVYGADRSWVELTPMEASKLRADMMDCVSSTVENWLHNKGLVGKVVDHVGVAVDAPFAQLDYRPRQGDSLHRPVSTEDFERNEARIAREVERDALLSSPGHRDDATVAYFDGPRDTPSRCHAIHARHDGRIFFALVHIPSGGANPTSMIESLTVEMWKRFYPTDSFDAIEWFDCYSDAAKEGHVSVSRVNLTSDDPLWIPADLTDLPPDLCIAICDAIAADNARAERRDWSADLRECVATR